MKKRFQTFVSRIGTNLHPSQPSPPPRSQPEAFTSMEKHASDRLVFIKLGGSLISDKTKPETLRGEVLDRIARCSLSCKKRRRNSLDTHSLD